MVAIARTRLNKPLNIEACYKVTFQRPNMFCIDPESGVFENTGGATKIKPLS